MEKCDAIRNEQHVLMCRRRRTKSICQSSVTFHHHVPCYHPLIGVASFLLGYQVSLINSCYPSHLLFTHFVIIVHLPREVLPVICDRNHSTIPSTSSAGIHFKLTFHCRFPCQGLQAVRMLSCVAWP